MSSANGTEEVAAQGAPPTGQFTCPRCGDHVPDIFNSAGMPDIRGVCVECHHVIHHPPLTGCSRPLGIMAGGCLDHEPSDRIGQTIFAHPEVINLAEEGRALATILAALHELPDGSKERVLSVINGLVDIPAAAPLLRADQEQENRTVHNLQQLRREFGAGDDDDDDGFGGAP